MTDHCLTAAFYRFVALPDFRDLQAPLRALCERLNILGTILLAEEGINGNIAGAPDAVRTFFEKLAEDSRFAQFDIKESIANDAPFHRLKVRLKKEIVTLKVAGIDPVHQAGECVEPENWNALLDDPDVLVVDTRNDYEVALGSFDGALDPQTRSFGELPQWLDEQVEIRPDTRVAMFCTGGIRCEKSTALLRSRGIGQTYHLRGGILNYLAKIEPQENMFNGHCFVFDERVALGPDLKPGPFALCRACRIPLSKEDMQSSNYEEGISCARCIDKTTPEQKKRFAERHRQMALARAKGYVHLGQCSAPKGDLHLEQYSAQTGILYSFRRCPYAMRARMALRAAGIPVQLREVVLRDKPQAMLDASPKGTVPVLLLDDQVMDESLEIMRFALIEHDPHQWLQPDVDDVAQMHALIAKCDGDFKYNLDRYKYATHYDDADWLKHRAAGEVFLDELEERLHRHAYLSGTRRSQADVAIAPFVRQFRVADRQWFDQQPRPALRAWIQDFERWPLFVSIMDNHAPWQPDDEPVLL